LNSVVSKFLALTLMLALILFSSFNSLYASASSPRIYITPPPSKTFPLKVYVYPTALDVDHGKEFACQHQEEFTLIFYDVLRAFRKVVFRFIDEHPEFHKLLEIRFVNVSKPNEADITFRVIEQEGIIAYTNFTGAWTPYQSQIYVSCDLFDRGSKEWVWGVIFHEFGHALGLSHAYQDHTDDGKLELMRGAAMNEKTYPSTLDLYAIHEIFFNHHFHEIFETTTLPENLEYEMVIPYDVELQQLREENERLETEVSRLVSDLNELQGELDQMNELINEITQENQQLKEQVSSLWGSIENLTTENAFLKSQLQEYKTLALTLNQTLAVKIKTLESQQTQIQSLRAENQQLSSQLRDLEASLSQTEAENQTLKQQLQQANRIILVLSVLAICLIAITLVAIAFKRRG